MESFNPETLDMLLKLFIAAAFGGWAWFLKRWIEKTDKHFDMVMNKIWDHEKRISHMEARSGDCS